MIRNDVAIGSNRTGIELSPIDKRELSGASDTEPAAQLDDPEIAETRAECIDQAEPVGTIPPPASVKGIVTTGVEAVKGVNVSMLIDKLGERLAFERTGVRLYGALADKCHAYPPSPGGPTCGDLLAIRAEELRHFELVRDAIASLGADPTAMTPSADVVAVVSTGILQVVTDARTSLRQSLEAMLVAELSDLEGWSMLIDLMRTAGHDDLVDRFEEARTREVEHLGKLRRWVMNATLALALPAKAKA
jgi:ferritin-like protein